jgi:hypothetical protein
MGQITIRGIAPEIEKEIRRISKESGKSINLVIQEIIHQHAGFSKKPKNTPSESLRRLAGGWSEKEAGDFLAAIKSCEQVDEELWK